jgi:hypothetical protein
VNVAPLPTNADDLVARGEHEGRVRGGNGARALGAVRSRRISVFMEIPQLIGCFLSVIMGRGAIPSGQSGRNGQTGSVRSQAANKAAGLPAHFEHHAGTVAHSRHDYPQPVEKPGDTSHKPDLPSTNNLHFREETSPLKRFNMWTVSPSHETSHSHPHPTAAQESAMERPAGHAEESGRSRPDEPPCGLFAAAPPRVMTRRT